MSWTQTRSQLLLEDSDVSEGAVIGAARTLARNIRGGDDVNLVAQVIEGQQPIEEHQHAIGQGKVVFRVITDSFQLADRVIGKISDSPSSERRQAGNGRRTMLPEQLFQHGQYAARALFASLAELQHNVFAAGSDLQIGTCAEERIASDLFAALDRLQQKSVRLIGSNGKKGRDRRQQIGRDRLDYGDQREFAGQARKLFVVGAQQEVPVRSFQWNRVCHYKGNRQSDPRNQRMN